MDQTISKALNFTYSFDYDQSGILIFIPLTIIAFQSSLDIEIKRIALNQIQEVAKRILQKALIGKIVKTRDYHSVYYYKNHNHALSKSILSFNFSIRASNNSKKIAGKGFSR
jgi:hypothetical protein